MFNNQPPPGCMQDLGRMGTLVWLANSGRVYRLLKPEIFKARLICNDRDGCDKIWRQNKPNDRPKPPQGARCFSHKKCPDPDETTFVTRVPVKPNHGETGPREIGPRRLKPDPPSNRGGIWRTMGRRTRGRITVRTSPHFQANKHDSTRIRQGQRYGACLSFHLRRAVGSLTRSTTTVTNRSFLNG